MPFFIRVLIQFLIGLPGLLLWLVGGCLLLFAPTSLVATLAGKIISEHQRLEALWLSLLGGGMLLLGQAMQNSADLLTGLRRVELPASQFLLLTGLTFLKHLLIALASCQWITLFVYSFEFPRPWLPALGGAITFGLVFYLHRLSSRLDTRFRNQAGPDQPGTRSGPA